MNLKAMFLADLH